MAGMAFYNPDRGGFHKNPYEGETDEERKRRYQKMYGVNVQEHEFVIKGEKILAKDKKSAIKIYNRRHNGRK